MNNSDAEKNTYRDGDSTPENSNPAQPQFRSRRERRLSETTALPVIPSSSTGILPPVPSFFSSFPPVEEKSEEVEAPAASEAPELETMEAEEDLHVDETEEADAEHEEEPTPPVQEAPALTFYGSADVEKAEEPETEAAPEGKAHARRRAPKEYWGGLAVLASGVAILVSFLVVSILIGVYLAFKSVESGQTVTNSTSSSANILSSHPVLLIIIQAAMYATWLGCMWWVTQYRSGVQRGRNFWAAFKDNFRLNIGDKKKVLTDVLLGVGTAVVMLGFQFFVLDFLIPQLFPKFDMSSADNTGVFKGLSGLWFYIISFGIGGILGPICEELFFRGFLLRGFSNHFSYNNRGRNLDLLEEGFAEKDLTVFASMMVSYRSFTHKYRNVLSAVLTTIVFGASHLQALDLGALVPVVFTAILGGVFAVLALKRNSLVPSMTAHVLYNSTLMFLIALGR